MAESKLASQARAERREREARLTVDERSALAQAAAEQGVRDYAATHGISYGEAKRRLDAAARAGRQPSAVTGE
jgi:hypothetical protein